MRIGIDARMYQEGLGIGRYIAQLIQNLETIDHKNDYIIFLGNKNWDRYTPRAKNFIKVRADIPWYGIREQVILPFILYRNRLDLMHFPHFSVPLLYRKSFVVTIHDLIMMNMPKSSRMAATTRSKLAYRVKYAAYRFLISMIVRRAKDIITVSNASKSEIVKTFKITQNRIHVIYNGITAPNIPMHPKRVLKPYFLCVGNAYPHKNINNVLLAWKRLMETDSGYYLFFCGQEDYFSEQVKQTILRMGLERAVFHLGQVSDKELAWLYMNAVALLAPSLCEGFGLQTLEAISYGLPVLASDIPVFHEILGTNAYYFDPTNPTAIAQSISHFIPQRTLWVQKIQIAKNELHKRFDWRVCAADTLQIYMNSIL